jgi:hypothetical protein
LAIGAPVVAVVVAVLMAPRAGGPQLCCPRTASHFVAVNGSFVRELSMLDIGHASWPSLNIFKKWKHFIGRVIFVFKLKELWNVWNMKPGPRNEIYQKVGGADKRRL